ncbi:MAG TPA: RpiB/LacA/LacB family sugar-phosphate isomerase [Candidatus Limnocylindrales bacterium]|nr:RpiB/LacA/LacB family sugar-phosphate isomerase [Candidatus Limnocylindrales bacterium]
MKVFVGADHNGFYLRNNLVQYLKRAGYDVQDDGDLQLDQDDDFPVFASRVVHDMQASDDPTVRGILICGSGQGMCMAANRYKGIRACMGYDRESIKATRNDEDSNVLCLAARVLEKDKINMLVETFLNTPFSHLGRYQRRLKEMDNL